MEALAKAYRKRYPSLTQADANCLVAVLIDEVGKAIARGDQITVMPERFLKQVQASTGQQILDAETARQILTTDLVEDVMREVRHL